MKNKTCPIISPCLKLVEIARTAPELLDKTKQELCKKNYLSCPTYQTTMKISESVINNITKYHKMKSGLKITK